MQPEAVHFCYRGKEHPGYRAFVHAMVQAGNPWARSSAGSGTSRFPDNQMMLYP
jgi:hypothetical protein